MEKGDIVLITFPFTDLSGEKLRPAVVLFTSRLDVTVCFITTKIHWQESTDILIEPSESNGVLKESLIRLSKIATLEKTLIAGLLGTLSPQDIISLNLRLKSLFKL
jgi:mRNA interferase MazF